MGAFADLTDVLDETYPAFCVVPRSYHCDTQHNLPEAQKRLGDEYREQPLFAPAGSCIFYDIALFHTRLDGIGIPDEATHGRRTIHE
jgi:ectoine hydroxylase-related dioxygenase (phytanoyl-CoA dioxygenase family)